MRLLWVGRRVGLILLAFVAIYLILIKNVCQSVVHPVPQRINNVLFNYRSFPLLTRRIIAQVLHGGECAMRLWHGTSAGAHRSDHKESPHFIHVKNQTFRLLRYTVVDNTTESSDAALVARRVRVCHQRGFTQL
jgi:hypothetical protein